MVDNRPETLNLLCVVSWFFVKLPLSYHHEHKYFLLSCKFLLSFWTRLFRKHLDQANPDRDGFAIANRFLSLPLDIVIWLFGETIQCPVKFWSNERTATSFGIALFLKSLIHCISTTISIFIVLNTSTSNQRLTHPKHFLTINFYSPPLLPSPTTISPTIVYENLTRRINVKYIFIFSINYTIYCTA